MTNTTAPVATPNTAGIDPQIYARRWAVLGILCLSLVLVVAAVSSVNTAIPSIRLQLLPSDAQLLWIVDIYAVVFAGLLLPAGALGDRFGRKGALQLGLATFAFGSVLSSQAGSPAHLLAFRCVMGLGAAFIMPSTLSLLTSVFPPAERPKAIAVWTGFAGAGGVIGTLMSGLMLAHFSWGSVFFVSVPIAMLALVLVSVICPSSKEEHVTPLDPIGAAMSVLGFGSLLYGIIEGPGKGWTSIHSVAAFALAIVGLAGFVLWERRSANPMLDVRFFAIPRFGAGALGVTFTFFSMFAMFFLLAQYLQSVRGYSPLKGGVCSLPFAVTMIATSPRGAALAVRLGPRRVVLIGMSIIPIGLVALSLVTATSPYLLLAAGLVVLAAGVALAMPTLSTGIVLSLPMSKAGVGSAVNDTTREVGGAVGIAVLGSILSSHYRSGMKGVLAQLPPSASEVATTARRGVGALAGLVAAAPGVPALKDRLPQLQALLATAKTEFVGGLQIGLRVTAVIMAIVAAIVYRWYPEGPLRPAGMGPAESH